MLKVNQVSFAYTKEKPTLQNISFEVKKGEQIAVIGESGCGKSTLLHLIYGKLGADQGDIFWNNKKILGPAYKLIPGEEDVKLLTQEFDLMPYTSVEANVKKHLSRVYPKENQVISDGLLKTVDMLPLAKVLVKNLSGGQKQRVAIAQALANKPKLLLLDEPFSHIDQFKKNQLRRNLFAFLKKENITCLFATHDATDMLSFSDKTLVLQSGKLLDFRSPENLYQNPKSYKIAALFGEVNKLEGRFFFNESGQYLVYPNEVSLNFSNGDLSAQVLNSYFVGDRYLITLQVQNQTIYSYHPKAIKKGREVKIKLKQIDFNLRRIEGS